MYKEMARVYDALTKDVNYESLADYLEAIFRKCKAKPELVLDLGCGTGTLALLMSKRGYDMIGIDASADMLACAMEKKAEAGANLLFLQQDMCDFELYGTVGAVLCTLDAVNYVTQKRDLKRMFHWVWNYLDPQGLFVFDINSAYKLSTLLPSQTWYEIGEDVSWIWNCGFDKRRSVCSFDLTLFLGEKDGLYSKHDEWHEERAWTVEELTDMLQQAGLDLVGVYGDRTFKRPGPKAERIFFVAQKR